MKKLFVLALCLVAVASAGAQKKTVDEAAKLAGNASRVADARALIGQAMQDPETANDARTYFEAGNIERGYFDAADKMLIINPNADVDRGQMYGALINAYDYYMKAMPLANVPDAKGKVNTKIINKIASNLTDNLNDFFNAGGTFFNTKKYYPEAYRAFMIYGDLPAEPYMTKAAVVAPDSVRATAYFNAGLAAYSGNEIEKSADAFAKARATGYSKPEAYIYEIACYQALAQRDSTKVNLASQKIFEIANDGYEAFGASQPLFLNNVVNSLVMDKKFDQAYQIVSNEIANNPDNASLYALRGFIYDRDGKEELSEADYRKVADMPNADFESLKNAAKKIARRGTEIYNTLDGKGADVAAKREDVKVNYFERALDIARRAAAMEPNNPEIANIIDSMTYNLETYF